MKTQHCDVDFNILIPQDIERNPYILFTSHGTHTHPPPPPSKTPPQIWAEIQQLVQRLQDPDLRLSKCNSS
jgi:hypothetical protein